MTDAKIRSVRKLLNQGTPPREVADTLGVSVPTLYRWVPAATDRGTKEVVPAGWCKGLLSRMLFRAGHF
ncbi:hypothetical protein ARTHRO9V_280215 [Arthrobacter sp. 9V]|uniref:helix-turn-helix domain-containing protein n=1 Tax=Arthrobacter sp. 9V TaxID=2653132 RepID=UPI0012EF8B72|nr:MULTISPECIES: helix-turn-helix domain-containing protein [Micrococcaceae]VXC47671.1 hypothetical protein ARTHRO9V_280215 [Arthrobacter sp. 9V]